MLVIVGSVFVVLVALWHFFWKPLYYWEKMGVPQCKNTWMFVGDVGPVVFRRMTVPAWVKSIYHLSQDSRYVGFYNFNSPVLILKDLDLIKQVAIKDFDSFTDHPPLVDPEADPLFSNNLLALTGDKWRRMRHLISPTFTASKMKMIYKLIDDVTKRFVHYFKAQNQDVIEIDVKDTFARFTNDVIATTAFGIEVNSLANPDNMIYKMGKRITDFGGILNSLRIIGNQVLPSLFKFFGATFLDPAASKYFTHVIEETIKERIEKNVIRPDIINLLLEATKEDSNEADKISHKMIASQAVIFFFAGFETVSTVLTFGAYELAINKSVQDKLRKEMKASNGEISYDELNRMSYLDNVISEILRKWSPLPFLDRVCTKDRYIIQPQFEHEQPVEIKKNQEVWFPIAALHYDPKLFPEPESFKPERFSDPSNIANYSYMPFGVGPRNCVGNRFAIMEIKSLLCRLLLNFEIVPTANSRIPLVLGKDLFLRPEGELQLGLKPIWKT